MRPDLVQDKNRTPAMFDTIARRYDLLNHLLSFNVDRHWRRQLVAFADVRAGERVLDVATGTGDVAIEFARDATAGEIVGVDLSSEMLRVARDKLAHSGLSRRIALREGDALALPFDDASFDVVTVAFGLRNLPDYRRGVCEMARVLAPGGRAVVLEFLPPRGAAMVAYRAYLSTVLPVTGRLVSGSREAYRYLSASVREFISEDEVRALLAGAGLTGVESRRLTGKVAGLYRGVKS
ncbi:MAG: bifunctional demethylmenaquinone methyltransferase/2-methoxy-6-polyprenyl-1,4-benzoquinol methylase UbiE [Candidatus Latescibacteria bacterium]|nr:bifunctional demethylmenaquinone methyltransferase/2-methoxy-6-polyprenyl-1,4-benzoquinol methylase UbiE [Candidatus Latescibacterota bacterium]